MIEGFNGQLELLDEAIVIHRRGLGAAVYHKNAGELVLPFLSITGIKFAAPGWLLDGYIRFDDGSFDSTAPFNQYKDKRTVIFKKSQTKDFDGLRDEVEQRLRRIILAPARGRPMGVADELSKLARLVERGLLTTAEFERQKAKLLRDGR